MIYTITLNLALDRRLWVEQIQPDAANRIEQEQQIEKLETPLRYQSIPTSHIFNYYTGWRCTHNLRPSGGSFHFSLWLKPVG